MNIDQTFMEIALVMSKRSHCLSHRVAAVITKNDRIVSTGYNGTPSGCINCDAYFSNIKYKDSEFKELHHEFAVRYEIHAEQNAIAEMAKNTVSSEGTTLYCTLSPCSQCAKLILAAGIKRVVYLEKYERDLSGIQLLEQSNVKVEQICMA